MTSSTDLGSIGKLYSPEELAVVTLADRVAVLLNSIGDLMLT